MDPKPNDALLDDLIRRRLDEILPGRIEEKLAETIAAIEAELAAKASSRVPKGYTLRSEGGAVVVGRDTCVTAETMWKWRELEWPGMREEEAPEEGGALLEACFTGGAPDKHI